METKDPLGSLLETIEIHQHAPFSSRQSLLEVQGCKVVSRGVILKFVSQSMLGLIQYESKLRLNKQRNPACELWDDNCLLNDIVGY